MLYAGGWDPSIYLTTTVAYSDKIKWFIRMKTFCYRKNGYIDVHYHQYTPDIQNLLGEQMRHPGRVHHATISLSTVCVCVCTGAMHRRVIAANVDKFDLFIYHEDDIVVRPQHLTAFVNTTRHLYELLGREALKEYLVGTTCCEW
jgi:hypothetical protein